MLPGPDFDFLGRRCSAYRICGSAGYLLAVLFASVLARHAGLSELVVLALAATGVPVFLAVVMATKILTGEERIVYYHHQIAVLLAAGLLLRTIGRPLLPYLDVTALGLGVFLACGRIGCLLVGCCHGRPRTWGVRYGRSHAAAGLPAELVGVPLFPVQAVESLWVLSVVAAGTVIFWRGGAAGAALGWYVAAYGAGRFALEFARGDAGRPQRRGLSQPQWISMLLVAAGAVLLARGPR